MAIEEQAKEAKVPYWKQEQVFREACVVRDAKIREAYASSTCDLSPADFADMAKRATTIPFVRPSGASQPVIDRLAEGLCQSVSTILRSIDEMTVVSRDGNAVRFTL